MNPKPKPAHECPACGQAYSKRDFDICPHCGGDGGGRTPKVWKPNKHQKKAFIKKMKQE